MGPFAKCICEVGNEGETSEKEKQTPEPWWACKIFWKLEDESLCADLPGHEMHPCDERQPENSSCKMHVNDPVHDREETMNQRSNA